MSAMSQTQRSAEWLLALVLAIVTLPLLALTAAASALAYRASPFFVHQRIGRQGRPFTFVKVRTLPPTTSRYADKHSIARTAIPRSMQLVRKTHLDELPQLWMVLTGHLSLVGPRAEMAMLHERISARAAAERLSVRPGVTGLWQVSVHCDGLICDRVEYDRLYVQHRNPMLDAWILWKTVEKMLLGRTVHLYDVPRWAIAAMPAEAVIDLTAGAPTFQFEPVPASPVLAPVPVGERPPALSSR